MPAADACDQPNTFVSVEDAIFEAKDPYQFIIVHKPKSGPVNTSIVVDKPVIIIGAGVCVCVCVCLCAGHMCTYMCAIMFVCVLDCPTMCSYKFSNSGLNPPRNAESTAELHLSKLVLHYVVHLPSK